MTAVSLLTVLLTAFPPASAAAADPVGLWDCSAITPNGNEVPWTLTVARDEGKLSATIKSDRGEMRIPEARMDGDTLVFMVRVGEGSFEMRLTIDEDKLKGEWKGSEASGAIRGTRNRKSG